MPLKHQNTKSHKTLFSVFALSISLLFCHFSFSQISTGGKPYSFINPLKNNIHTVTMPALDMTKIQREDSLDEQMGKIPKFGRLHTVSLNPVNSGTWTDLDNGDRVWRIKLVSINALAISLYYDNFYIPDGAIMFVYNEDRSEVIGGFTSINNHSSGLFATSLLRGDATIIEYYEPAAVKGNGIISISDVAHAYRFVTPLNGAEKSSDPCEVDVICSEGDCWRDQIRSVAKIQIKEGVSVGFCSGAVVNNVRQDCTPYFLTARHCGETSSATDLNQTIFYFNYERTVCGSGIAPQNQSMTGATRRADDGGCGGTMGSDFLLLQINNTIPSAYNVFYAGWNATTTPSPSGVSIHHPNSDEKKISTYTTPLTTQPGSWCIPNTHWRVFWVATANGHGVTEGGSSGSPLLDNNGRIVGTLTGGGSFCSQVPNPSSDYYGKMSYHWASNGAAANQRIKNWLDPDNTGTLTLDGANPPCTPLSPFACPPPVSTDDAGISNVITANSNGTICSTAPVVTLKNFGSDTLTSATINYNIDNGPNNTYNWTGSLATFETEEVTLPGSPFSSGTGIFTVYTTNPNDTADINTSNDTISSSYIILQGSPLTLTLTTDASVAFFVSWDIRDSTGAIVDSDSGYANNTINIENLCLVDGCYDFTIYDPAGNNGYCNTGSYLLVTTSGDTLVFGCNDTTYSFCVTAPPVSSVKQYDPVLQTVIYPNPTNGKVTVSSDSRITSIEILNVLGERIYETSSAFAPPKPSPNGEGLNEIDLTSRPNGIYFAYIKTDTDVIVRKIILIR